MNFLVNALFFFFYSIPFLFFMTPIVHAASPDQNDSKKIAQIITSAITIRSLAPEDWKEFRNLRLKALQENPIAYGIAVTDESNRSDGEWKSICHDAYEGKGRWYFIAEYKNQLVGMIGADEHSGSYMSHLAEIVAAYVNPDFRRSGVMKQLFHALKNRLLETPHIEQLIAWVTLHDNQTGRYVFEHLGFEYRGKLSRCVKYDGRYYDCCWLEAFLR
jgi:RimJ/RimL family protein N-acetyltransferase